MTLDPWDDSERIAYPVSLSRVERANQLGQLYRTGQRTTLAAGASLEVLLTVPAGEIEAHIDSIEYSSTAEAVVDEYHMPTVTTPGTEMNIHNKNHRATRPATVDAERNGTYDLTGLSPAHEDVIGAGNRARGTEQSGDHIMAPDDRYLFRLTSQVNDNTVAINLVWHEEPARPLTPSATP